MNRDEFETYFSGQAKAAWTWSTLHKNIVFPAAIFVIAFILGAVSCHS